MSNQEYYQIFMNQFIQTLAQLSAVIVSGSLAVPVYSYYVKGRAVQQNLDSTRYTENEFLNADESSSDSGYGNESDSENSSIIIGNEPPTFIEKQEFKDDSTSTF